MAKIAQKSSKNADTIEGSIHKATEDIQQVAQTAQSQAQLAQKLNEIVQKFKV